MYNRKYMTYELQIARLQDELQKEDSDYCLEIMIGKDTEALYPLGYIKNKEQIILPVRVIYDPLKEINLTRYHGNEYVVNTIQDLKAMTIYILRNPQVYLDNPEEF